MTSLLFVGINVSELPLLDLALRGSGAQVMVADAYEDAALMIQRYSPRVVVIDTGSRAGADLISAHQPNTAGVTRVTSGVMRATGSTATKTHSESGLGSHDLARALATVLGNVAATEAPPPTPPRHHASERWANIVAAVVDSPGDLRTIAEWGRWVGVSSGALRCWCRTSGVSAKCSLDFARILRAILRCSTGPCNLADVLDVADKRTLSKLLRLGGRTQHHSLPLSVEAYFDGQQWVQGTHALGALRAALQARVDRGDTLPSPSVEHVTRRSAPGRGPSSI